MPGLLHERGLPMAIKKRKVKLDGSVTTVPAPDFSFSPNDSLAQMIVDLWVDDDYRAAVLKRKPDGTPTDEAAALAQVSLAARGFYLDCATVITEDEYDADYTAGPTEIVFVLPDAERVTPRAGQSLLDTARLLMATTPNGI